MQFPESIKIGNVTYRLESDPSKSLKLAKDSCYGEIDHEKQVINLNDDQKDEHRRDTLFHEVLHGVTRHTCLDREWGDKEEQWTERLETALLMVFQDNPGLVAILRDVPDDTMLLAEHGERSTV